MELARGTCKEGRIVLDDPPGWPDGTRVGVVPLAVAEAVGLRDEDWPTDPEGVAALLKRMDEALPIEIDPEDAAESEAWRQEVRDYTIANMGRRIEGLFP
jgi:hypothetical protein